MVLHQQKDSLSLAAFLSCLIWFSSPGTDGDKQRSCCTTILMVYVKECKSAWSSCVCTCALCACASKEVGGRHVCLKVLVLLPIDLCVWSAFLGTRHTPSLLLLSPSYMYRLTNAIYLLKRPLLPCTATLYSLCSLLQTKHFEKRLRKSFAQACSTHLYILCLWHCYARTLYPVNLDCQWEWYFLILQQM